MTASYPFRILTCPWESLAAVCISGGKFFELLVVLFFLSPLLGQTLTHSIHRKGFPGNFIQSEKMDPEMQRERWGMLMRGMSVAFVGSAMLPMNRNIT